MGGSFNSTSGSTVSTREASIHTGHSNIPDFPTIGIFGPNGTPIAFSNSTNFVFSNLATLGANSNTWTPFNLPQN